MNKSNFIRLSGWSIIVGAIAFLPGSIGMLSWGESTGPTSMIMQLASFAVFWVPVFLAVGLLGMRARYKIGGGFLLFGAIVGGLLVVVGILVQFITPDYSVSIAYYYVWLGGVFVLNVCLSIFGVMALIQKPLPRWNWIPLAAGAWILLFLLLAGIAGSPSSPVMIAMLVLMTIAQAILGYILQANTSLEMESA